MDNFTIAVNRYLREFKEIGKKQKILILAVLIGSLLFGLFLPVAINNLSSLKPPKITPSPTPIPIPAVISLSTDLPAGKAGKNEVETDATFSATININSVNQGVEAADFVINFDPDYLSVATVSSGNYFGLYPVKEIGADSVKISGIANLVDNKFIIPIGKGVIAKIVFETLSATESTKISFDREKTIVASGGKNILDRITNLEVRITEKE